MQIDMNPSVYQWMSLFHIFNIADMTKRQGSEPIMVCCPFHNKKRSFHNIPDRYCMNLSDIIAINICKLGGDTDEEKTFWYGNSSSNYRRRNDQDWKNPFIYNIQYLGQKEAVKVANGYK